MSLIFNKVIEDFTSIGALSGDLEYIFLKTYINSFVMLPWWHTHFIVSFFETDKIGALKMFPIYNKFFNQMTVFVDFFINPTGWCYVRAEKL